MFVEDLLIDLAGRVLTADDMVGEALRSDDWTRKFILSIKDSVTGQKVNTGKGWVHINSSPLVPRNSLSSEQARVFLRVVKNLHEAKVLEYEGFNVYQIDNLIARPQYRNEPYQSSNIPREVRYIGDNKIAFRFKRVEEIVNDIKALGQIGRKNSWQSYQRASYNKRGRFWIVPVTALTFDSVMQIIAKYEFQCDDAVYEYLALADSSKGQNSTFALDPESGKIVANITDSPLLTGWVTRVLFGEKM